MATTECSGPSPTWHTPNARICSGALPSLLLTMASGMPAATNRASASMLCCCAHRHVTCTGWSYSDAHATRHASTWSSRTPISRRYAST